MLGHVFSNLGLSLTRGIGATLATATRSATAYKDGDALIKYHEAQLGRLAANFAFASDLALLLGGRLKFEELLMGRLSDAMSAIFLGYATLHHFARNKASVEGLNAVAESSMLMLEVEAQTALDRFIAARLFEGLKALFGETALMERGLFKTLDEEGPQHETFDSPCGNLGMDL